MGDRKRDDSAILERLRGAFAKIKNELEDHLDAINQNTGDVHELHSLLGELDAKIDKLSERLDEIEVAVNPKKNTYGDIKLTPREQEVFMGLYLTKGATIASMSKRLGFTADRVNMYLLNLISKGVPIKRELVDDVLVFSLEADFKDLQARRNILSIDPRIVKQMSTTENDM